jgi:hypothetical protein
MVTIHSLFLLELFFASAPTTYGFAFSLLRPAAPWFHLPDCLVSDPSGSAELRFDFDSIWDGGDWIVTKYRGESGATGRNSDKRSQGIFGMSTHTTPIRIFVNKRCSTIASAADHHSSLHHTTIAVSSGVRECMTAASAARRSRRSPLTCDSGLSTPASATHDDSS